MPSNRTTLIAGNWKMNNDREEAKALASALVEALPEVPAGVEVCVCPPTIDLCCVSHKLDGSAVKLGAQNVYFEAKGAYTGETSVAMLKSVPVQYCIIGHSERREMFAETDAMVNKKVRALVENGMKAIVCVGESLSVRDAGNAEGFVCDQVRAAFAGLSPEEAALCTIAYEPIWAIGTGRTATPEQAESMAAAIRATVRELVGDLVADDMRILYGGSMKPANAEAFLACENVDGGLIGGAALKAEDFAALVAAAAGE